MSRKAAVHLAFGVFALAGAAQVARFGGLETWASACVALACLAAVHYSAAALCDRSPAWLIAGGWLVACTPFAFWTADGLVVPASALVALALLLALQRGHAVLGALAAAGLAALRPQGALTPLVIVAHALWTRHRDGETPPWLRTFALAAVPLTPLAAAHWVMPQVSWPAPGPGALLYLHDVVAGYLPVPVLVLAVAAVSFRGGEGPLFTLPPALIAAEVAWVMATGGDPAPLYRPFMTWVPIAFLLAAAGLETVLGLIGAFLSGIDRAAAVAGVLICALQLHHVPADHRQAVLRSRERKTPAIFWNSPP